MKLIKLCNFSVRITSLHKNCNKFVKYFNQSAYLYEVTCSIDSKGTSKPHSSWISILAVSAGLMSLSIIPAQSS